MPSRNLWMIFYTASAFCFVTERPILRFDNIQPDASEIVKALHQTTMPITKMKEKD